MSTGASEVTVDLLARVEIWSISLHSKGHCPFGSLPPVTENMVVLASSVFAVEETVSMFLFIVSGCCCETVCQLARLPLAIYGG